MFIQKMYIVHLDRQNLTFLLILSHEPYEIVFSDLVENNK